jgi:predicted nucleic acid-binding protein/N-acetylglutamate synthase-like GNAT family acetyltransferase
VLSITLDTSCAQNFLSDSEEPDRELIELVGRAVNATVDLSISEAAHAEVARTPDEGARRRRLERLRAFKTVVVPEHRAAERDQLAKELHAAAFSNSVSGSRTNDHNTRDCLQVATHFTTGRAVFVTRDAKLLKKAGVFAERGIAVSSPREVIDRLNDQSGDDRLPIDGAASIREARLPEDESEIREILAPLADDYPRFEAWLTDTFKNEKSRIRVADLHGRVAAVSITKQKDARVMKLSAFYVGEFARAGGVGGHLLWSEIRAWVAGGVEKAYVTVSSSHADLVEFFVKFGFLVEGSSSRRYSDDAAELVLAKHLVRAEVDPSGLDVFAETIAAGVFGLPPGVSLPQDAWAILPAAAHPTLSMVGEGSGLALQISSGGQLMRELDTYELENVFHPLRLAVPQREVLIVPLRPEWADAMIQYVKQRPQLFDEGEDPALILRTDNAYYCSPKYTKLIARGMPILLYVAAPEMSFVAEARIDDFLIASPEEAFAEFGDLGIYQLDDVRGHVGRGVNGALSGKVLALRFSMYTSYPDPVARSDAEAILDRKLTLQGLASISYEEYELLRRNSGLEW